MSSFLFLMGSAMLSKKATGKRLAVGRGKKCVEGVEVSVESTRSHSSFSRSNQFGFPCRE